MSNLLHCDPLIHVVLHIKRILIFARWFRLCARVVIADRDHKPFVWTSINGGHLFEVVCSELFLSRNSVSNVGCRYSLNVVGTLISSL